MMNTLQYVAVHAQLGLRRFMKDEKGDTNFISILIILGVVIALAGVFISFKDQIVQEVQGIIQNFTISGGSTNTVKI